MDSTRTDTLTPTPFPEEKPLSIQDDFFYFWLLLG